MNQLVRMAVDQQRRVEVGVKKETNSGAGIRTMFSLFETCMDLIGSQNTKDSDSESERRLQ